MTRKTFPIGVGLWIVLTVLMVWPAVLNGGPAWFNDSISYLSAPTKAFNIILGLELDTFGSKSGVIVGTSPPEVGSAVTINNPAIGRSIYYGAVITVVVNVFGFWGVALFQGFYTLLAITFFSTRMYGFDLRANFCICLILGLLTPIAFFNIYLMPDFLAGLTVLATIVLLYAFRKLNHFEMVFWVLTLLFALTSHTSHLLISIALFMFFIVIHIVRRVSSGWSGIPAVICIFAASVFLETIYVSVVTLQHGHEPIRPPFVAARLIDDGPGYEFLRTRCPSSGYEYCRYADRLPTDSVHFLWSKDPETGVFAIADEASRSKMSDQQFAFLVDVVKAYPFQQFSASIKRFLEQLSRFSVNEFSYSDRLKGELNERMSEEVFENFSSTRLYKNTMPLSIFSYIFLSVFILSVFFIIFYKSALNLVRQKFFGLAKAAPIDLIPLVMIAAGLLVNAAITGVLSEPFDRYQGRVIWLATFSAAIMAAHSLRSESPKAMTARSVGEHTLPLGRS